MNPLLSVIICTHRPRCDYLGRTLSGLRRQSLPAAAWELIIVDNASPEPVEAQVDLRWHPAGRVVLEPELGLTAARFRGIAEARALLLVFVDDDNELAPDYLELAAARATAWPMLGVWGCGRYTPEWEEAPSPQFAPYLAYLAVREAPRDRWSNQTNDYAAVPAGAGLCVRAAVARSYADKVRTDPRRKLLGRSGLELGGCEDFDLAFTAIDLGFGIGVFREFALIHLMPKSRVQESYLLRLVEGHAYSTVVLMAIRDPALAAPRRRWVDRVRVWRLRRSLGLIERRLHQARRRGEARAWATLAQRGHPSST